MIVFTLAYSYSTVITCRESPRAMKISTIATASTTLVAPVALAAPAQQRPGAAPNDVQKHDTKITYTVDFPVGPTDGGSETVLQGRQQMAKRDANTVIVERDPGNM